MPQRSRAKHVTTSVWKIQEWKWAALGPKPACVNATRSSYRCACRFGPPACPSPVGWHGGCSPSVLRWTAGGHRWTPPAPGRSSPPRWRRVRLRTAASCAAKPEIKASSSQEIGPSLNVHWIYNQRIKLSGIYKLKTRRQGSNALHADLFGYAQGRF